MSDFEPLQLPFPEVLDSVDIAHKAVEQHLRRELLSQARNIASSIRQRAIDIYAPIDVGDPNLWFTTGHLQAIIQEDIRGMQLGQVPKTRSKCVKKRIAGILGYPIPATFKRHSLFPGQDCYISTMAADNFQPTNQNTELVPTRRYVIVQETAAKVAGLVKVVTGERLAELDRKGTLTTKFQAIFRRPSKPVFLASSVDTERVSSLIIEDTNPSFVSHSPTESPTKATLLAIRILTERLSGLIGKSFTDPGQGQDRKRGDELHRLVCSELGYSAFEDDGACPDVKHQLLEVKLQTQPTINIGLMSPDSEARLDMSEIFGVRLLHQDVRYLVAGATIVGDRVEITDLTMTTGVDFFKHMPRFEGNIVNTKRQVTLPRDFFSAP